MKYYWLYAFFFFFTLPLLSAAPSFGVPSAIDTSLGNTSFVVKNTGDVTLSSISIESDSSTLLLSFDGVTFQRSLFLQQLLVDESRIISLQSPIGENSMGTILLQSEQNVSSRITVSSGIGNKIVIDRVTLKFKNNKDSIDQDEIIKVDAGEKATLKIRVKNAFEGNIDIEKVTLDVTIHDIDNGDDLDYEESISTLRHGDEEEKEIDIVIPASAHDDTYDVNIIAKGEDERNFDHTSKFLFHLKVEKPSHDVRITSATVESSQLSCNKETSLHATIQNLGRNEERKTAITVASFSLGLDYAKYDLVLDQDSFEETSQYEVNLGIDARSKPNGNYEIIVRAYRDDTKLEDEKIITLSLVECINEQAIVTQETDNIVLAVSPMETVEEANWFFPILAFVVLIGACLITLLFIILALTKK